MAEIAEQQEAKAGDPCVFCKDGILREGVSVQWALDKDNPGEKVVVQLPCLKCDQCKEEIFSGKDGEMLDEIMESGFSSKGKTPLRMVEVAVYAYE